MERSRTYRYLMSLLVLLVAVMIGWSMVTGTFAQQSISVQIMAQIEGDSTSITARFYRQRSYKPAWIQGSDSASQIEALLDALRGSYVEGLDPQHYGIQALEELYNEAKTNRSHASRAELDMASTDAFFKLAAHMVWGRVNPAELYSNWIAVYREVDLVERLETALASRPLKSALEQLNPPYAGYRQLRTRLMYYRSLKGLGDVLEINQSLIDERIGQIIVNMERWRWLPDTLGERYLHVNLADYNLDIVDQGQIIQSKRVVIGRIDQQTPVLSSRITKVVLAPYWDVPYSIASKEILSILRRDVGYLSRHQMKLFKGNQEIDPETVDWSQVTSRTFTYFIRQEPGWQNALGMVKFVFPNTLGVLMHDTNERALFNRATRALSHGCVRVQEPLELAEYVLKDDTTWTGEKIKQIAGRKTPTSVSLDPSVPIHILYWTAWVGPDGLLHIRPDVYGHDRRLLEALFSRR